MLKNAIYGFALAVSVFAAGTAFADVPSMRQVEDAAQAGRLNEAHGMMQQVLKEHPASAKAHFVDAEILAKAGRMPEAKDELNAAEKLEPGLPFAKPFAVQELKAKLGAAHAAAPAAAATLGSQAETQSSGFPWGMLILGIAAIAVIAFIMRAMARPQVVPAPYPGNNPGGNYAGNYPPGMPPGGYGYGAPQPGIGSGIASGLATGAAVGVGVVAGEALAHHFLDGNHPDAAPVQPLASADNASNYDMGGNNFGVNDTSSWDDNVTMADSSGGGDDWT